MVINQHLRGQIGNNTFRMDASSFPLAGGSCDRISCLDVLEHVREDDTLIAECARVLKPGGTLQLRVPNTGPLAGIDPLNLYHYVVDITGRRPRPIENDEIGWRRHYSATDLTAMLQPWFTVTAQRTTQLGIAALVETGVLLLFRWLLGSKTLERRATLVVRRVEQIDNYIDAGDIGWHRTVIAIRRRSAI